MGLVKGAPARDAAIQTMDLISSAKYAKVLMDKGLNPSNNPANYPHSMPSKILEVNNAKLIGVEKWEDLRGFLLPINWSEWADKLDKYITIWENEVLKKR